MRSLVDVCYLPQSIVVAFGRPRVSAPTPPPQTPEEDEAAKRERASAEREAQVEAAGRGRRSAVFAGRKNEEKLASFGADPKRRRRSAAADLEG